MKNPRRFYRSLSRPELSARAGGIEALVRANCICKKAAARKLRMIEEVLSGKK